MKLGVAALSIPVVTYGLAWIASAIAIVIGALREPIEMGEVVFFGGGLFFGALWWAWVWALRDMARVSSAAVGARLVLRAVVSAIVISSYVVAGGFFVLASTWSLTGRAPDDGLLWAVAIGVATLVGIASEIAIVVASVQVFRTKA